MFFDDHITCIIFLKHNIGSKVLTKTVLQDLNTIIFPTVLVCLLQNDVLFTIRHNNSGLSKSSHEMSVASLQSFVPAAALRSRCSLLYWGVKWLFWWFMKNISKSDSCLWQCNRLISRSESFPDHMNTFHPADNQYVTESML